MTFDLKPKPAYNAVKIMITGLNGYTFIRRIDIKNENDYLLLFKNSKDRCKIVAWSIDPRHSASTGIAIHNVNKVSILDGKGNLLKAKGENESLILFPDELPQYISIPAGNIIR